MADELQVSLVPPGEVSRVWAAVGGQLDRAVHLSNGRYLLEDVRDELEQGNAHLWIIFDPETKEIVASATTNFAHYPRCKALYGKFLGGDRLDEWQDKFCDILDSWGRDNGCTIVEFAGRAGWSKTLKSNGYEESCRIYERVIP